MKDYNYLEAVKNDVLEYIKENGEELREEYENREELEEYLNDELWTVDSVTTMRHINSFLRFVGIPGGGKAWWDKQEV